MRRLLSIPILLAALLVGPVAAGAAPAQGLTARQIADELVAAGSYVEPSPPAGLDAAVAQANTEGIGFVWLDSEDDAQVVADAVLAELQLLEAPFRTVLALTDISVAASSETAGLDAINAAFDASFPSFEQGDVPGALDAFTGSLAGAALDVDTTATTTGGDPTGGLGDPATTAPAGTGDGAEGEGESSGGGFGLGSILLLLALAGGGFVAVRYLRNRGRARRQAEEDLEADRAEIEEQLRDNADAVLSLGDRVIASGDSDLMDLYEEASGTYQDVSLAVDAATTADEIDALDDRIDEAEWQFQVIEARLEGEPPPPSPAQIEAMEAEAAARERTAGRDARSDRPALDPDDSVFGPGSRRAPSRAPAPRRRAGGGLGGSLGEILGGVILGGGLGGLGGPRSRRSSRRTGFPAGMGRQRRSAPVGAGRRGGGLGGGVLRPGGSRSSGGNRNTAGRRFGTGSGGRTPRTRGRASRRF